MVDGEPLSDREKLFQNIQQDIRSLLMNKGGHPNAFPQETGLDVFTVASNLETDAEICGLHALTFSLREWIVTITSVVIPIPNAEATLERITLEYAKIMDSTARTIWMGFSPEIGNPQYRIPETAPALTVSWEERQTQLKAYVGENKDRLADSLIDILADRRMAIQDSLITGKPLNDPLSKMYLYHD